MPFLFLPASYFAWHYSRSLAEYWQVAGNLIWFVFNFFSINILIKTLLSPWHRLQDEPVPITKPIKFLEGFIVNFMMRLVGLIIRLSLLVFGLIFTLASIVVAVVGFIIWFLMPVLIGLAFIGGLYFLLI